MTNGKDALRRWHHFREESLANRDPKPGLRPLQPRRGSCWNWGNQTNHWLIYKRRWRSNPTIADAHYNLGNTFLQMGRANEAVARVQDEPWKSTRMILEALNNMAWILATWPDALTRDGTKAVELAERADSLTRGESPVISATLAAAYAEAGRFADAVKTGQRALQLARRGQICARRFHSCSDCSYISRARLFVTAATRPLRAR